MENSIVHEEEYSLVLGFLIGSDAFQHFEDHIFEQGGIVSSFDDFCAEELVSCDSSYERH